MIPRYDGFIKTDENHYAKLYFQKGNLGAPHWIYWDIDSCKLYLDNMSKTGMSGLDDLKLAISILEQELMKSKNDPIPKRIPWYRKWFNF